MASPPQQDFIQLGSDLEQQELEHGSTPCSPKIYSQLLAIYLLQNDLCAAKFLWKRISPLVKQSSPELTDIWAVGQKMWVKDYPGVYEALQKEWSEDVQAIMQAVTESFRQRALKLVQHAYSSISADDLAMFVGVPVDRAVQAAQEEGWEVDLQTRITIPKKLEPSPAVSIMNEQYLSVLTNYVTFMEN